MRVLWRFLRGVGKLGSWEVGKLESWKVGKLESWEVGKLGRWDYVETLQCNGCTR